MRRRKGEELLWHYFKIEEMTTKGSKLTGQLLKMESILNLTGFSHEAS